MNIPKLAPKGKTAETAAPVSVAAPAATPAPAPASIADAAPAEAKVDPVTPVATAVAVRPANAMAVASRPVDIVAETFKKAFTVEWNTLSRIQASNGNFLDMENNKKSIGAAIVLELLSFQDNYQISPGTDDKADIEFVRYSDDGVTTTQGENCQEYLAALKDSGRPNAKMGERVVLVGTLIGGEMDGKLVQMNLSPTSAQRFKRYRMEQSILGSRGADMSRCGVLKLTAIPTSKGDRTWTEVAFEQAPAPAA